MGTFITGLNENFWGTTVKISNVVDYSTHYQAVKHMTKDLYELLNNRQFDKADELSLQMLAEVKLLNNAIRSTQVACKW